MNWVVAAVVAVVGCVLYLWRGWSSSGHEDAFAAAVKDVIAGGAEPPRAKAPAAVQTPVIDRDAVCAQEPGASDRHPSLGVAAEKRRRCAAD